MGRAGVHWLTMETEEDEIRRMRRAAIFVQRIYMGEPAGSFPIFVRAAAGARHQHGDRQGDRKLATL